MGRSCITNGARRALYNWMSNVPNMARTGRVFLVAAAVLAVGLVALPAAATPSNVKVSRVHDPALCEQNFCTSADPKLASGAVVTRMIQIHASATAPTGNSIAWIEIQAREAGSGDQGWVCLRRWESQATTQWYDWDTYTLGSMNGCGSTSRAGEMTKNKTYDLRVRARDTGLTAGTAESSLFSLSLSNRPTAPSWQADPSVSGDVAGDPVVELRWNRQASDSIVEYHVVRENPDGSEIEFAFNANKPGAQGCRSSYADGYVCYDDFFPGSGYAGGYTYTLYAYRQTAATSGASVTSCMIYSGNCIESQGSNTEQASLRPKPSPSPSSSGGTSPSATPTGSSSPGGSNDDGRSGSRVLSTRPSPSGSAPDYSEFYEGEFDQTLPFQDRGGFEGIGPVDGGNLPGEQAQAFAPGYTPIGERDRRPFMALAGGLLMLLCAAHMGRVLLRQANREI